MKVLAFGTYDVDAHPRFGVILEGLRFRGVEVIEVNTPLGLDTATRLAMLRQPWRLPRLVLRILSRWIVLARRGRHAYERHAPDAVLVGYLGHFDVLLARLLFPGAAVVLDHLVFAKDTASDRGESANWKLRLLQALDSAATRAADLIVVDSREHADMVPPRLARNTVVVPVGAPDAWFRAGERAAKTPEIQDSDEPTTLTKPLSVVFFGSYTPLQGAPVIGSALAELSSDDDIAVTMIGRGQDLCETQRRAATNHRIKWVDWVPSSELPALVAGHDVCIGILGETPKGARVVPNKVYQGAAAGCAIITSDTRPQRAAFSAAALLVPPDDPGALVQALRELAADRGNLARLRSAARERALEMFSPSAIVDPLIGRLHQLSKPSTSMIGGSSVTKTPISHPLAPRAWLRYDVVNRLVAECRPSTILEIGCGQGAVGARLASRADYLAVEPDTASFQVAAPRITAAGGQILNTDHTGVPAGTTYDLVCAFEVLEHLEDDASALKEWAQLIRPGGCMMLSVPAFQSRFGPMDTRVGHYRRYDPQSMAELMREAGFLRPRVWVYGWPLGYALEAVRNRLDSRYLAGDQAAVETLEERTAASGRHQQPARAVLGRVIEFGTLPFRCLQRLMPSRGTGLVAVGTRAPESTEF